MTNQIFNDRGFLTAEGKAFLNDGFIKEVKKVIATAGNAEDVLTISCILKSIVGEIASNHIGHFIAPPPEKTKTHKPESPTSALRLLKSETKNNVIPFPGIKNVEEIKQLMSALTDCPTK